MTRWIRNLAKSHTSAGLRTAFRELRMELYLLRRHRSGVKKARTLATKRPLRLNLGSGFRPTPGWINVDLSDSADLALDLREPLPFPDGSVREIYTEHFFEHLSYPNLDDSTAWQLETATSRSDALTFLRECLRVLEPGGLFDIVVPDAECILQEYVARHQQGFPVHPWWGPTWCDTAMHCVNYVFRQGREHKYAYDGETLASVLERVGFVGVRRRAFDPQRDAENHVLGSLCMHAFKAPIHVASTIPGPDLATAVSVRAPEPTEWNRGSVSYH